MVNYSLLLRREDDLNAPREKDDFVTWNCQQDVKLKNVNPGFCRSHVIWLFHAQENGSCANEGNVQASGALLVSSGN